MININQEFHIIVSRPIVDIYIIQFRICVLQAIFVVKLSLYKRTKVRDTIE